MKIELIDLLPEPIRLRVVAKPRYDGGPSLADVGQQRDGQVQLGWGHGRSLWGSVHCRRLNVHAGGVRDEDCLDHRGRAGRHCADKI